jgi:hypothetical protein
MRLPVVGIPVATAMMETVAILAKRRSFSGFTLPCTGHSIQGICSHVFSSHF